MWASTSTKNPAYPDTFYTDSLIRPLTIDTIPAHTLEAFKDHRNTVITLTKLVEEATALLDALAETGINIDEVTQELEDEGVESFADSYD